MSEHSALPPAPAPKEDRGRGSDECQHLERGEVNTLFIMLYDRSFGHYFLFEEPEI